MKCGKCGKREEYYWLLSSRPEAKPLCLDCAQEHTGQYKVWDQFEFSLPRIVWPEPLIDAIETANES